MRFLITCFFAMAIGSSIVVSAKPSEFEGTKINAAKISVSSLPLGQAFRITFNWTGSPMPSDYTVWMNILNSSGKTVFKEDHSLPGGIKTTSWNGNVSYTRLIRVSDTLLNGKYEIVAGLLDRSKKTRVEISPGQGVTAGADKGYVIGSFMLDSKAPMPPLDSEKKKTLNLKGYKVTFREEFDGPLDISAWGPGTKWIAHTPYAGDFGDAKFTDPEPGFPFTVSKGLLKIEARKEGDKWKSGLICSVDKQGNGFAQQYGYFEMRAKFPKGPGTWPAFWLLALRKLKDKSDYGFEVDIIEQYGREPNIMHSVLHWWPPERDGHKSIGNKFYLPDMYKDFHTYGFMWDEETMIWYFDGVELWRQPTPEESKTPMYVLVNLALGPAWPLDKTPNPSIMEVDYVRVYTKEAKISEN